MAKPVDRPDDVSGGGGTGMSDDERDALVDTLAEEVGELFRGYATGDVAFEELTFEIFDTLQTLHALVTGNLTVEYYEHDEYDEFEELAGEPVDDSTNGRGRKGKRRG